jgi:chemotaxis protein histidine kinase CheA
MDPARLPDGISEQVLLELYVRSGTESMERLRTAIHSWEQTGSEADLADSRRLAHNLKGSSCQLGFDELAKLAAAMELFTTDLLRRHRTVDAQTVELIDAAAGLAISVLATIAEGAPIPDLAEMIARLTAGIA